MGKSEGDLQTAIKQSVDIVRYGFPFEVSLTVNS